MVDKAKLYLFLKFFVSFGLLVALAWIFRKNIGDIVNILRHSNKILFSVALVISLPLSIGLSYRLKFLMSSQKILLPLKDLIYLTFVGYFFNNFFPTAIGGDIVKAYYAAQKTRNRPATYAAVVVDRLIGFVSTISMAIIGIIFAGKDFNNKIIVAVVIMAIGTILVFIFLMDKKKYQFLARIFSGNIVMSRLIANLSKLYQAINFYRHNINTLIKTYLLGLLLQGGAIVSIYFFILCVGGNIDIFRLCLIIPLVWALSMLPSLNGLGVREGAFVYFLKGDIGAELAAGVSLLWLGVIILYSFIGGVLHILWPVSSNKIKVLGEVKGDAPV